MPSDASAQFPDDDNNRLCPHGANCLNRVILRSLGFSTTLLHVSRACMLVLMDAMKHPLTDNGIARFKADWAAAHMK